MAKTTILRAATAAGTPIAIRIRWTTVDGERGVVWEWALWDEQHTPTAWSDPNGPCPTKADARAWALDTVPCFP